MPMAALLNCGLGKNNLTGSIPPELGYLDNLTHLYLSNNHLSGEIPIALGNLTNLAYLYLHGYGQLTGCIPDGLKYVKNGKFNDLHRIGLPFCADAEADRDAPHVPVRFHWRRSLG